MQISLQNLKIALVHDWLLGIGGAEKVLKALHEIFPEAPIYTLFCDKNFTDKFLPNVEIRTSFLQKSYEVLRGHKFLIPFLPLAVESLDLSEFHLIVSSSSFVKGLILKPKTTHINYCPSPTRQVWDWWAEYKQERRRMPKWYISLFQHFIRIWDRQASTRVDYYATYSKTTQERIEKYYGEVSDIISPPVNGAPNQPNLFDLEPKNSAEGGSAFGGKNQKRDSFFLIVSRLYSHKNVHLAVKAFNKLKWPLVIIGDGPEFKKLKANAENNITLLGHQPDEVVQKYYARSCAFIMPQEEDFGLTPLEAMSYGKPVLALKHGGALEYVQEGINGEFFEDPYEEMLADGVRRLRDCLPYYDPEIIRKTVEKYSFQRFEKEIKNLIFKLI